MLLRNEYDRYSIVDFVTQTRRSRRHESMNEPCCRQPITPRPKIKYRIGITNSMVGNVNCSQSCFSPREGVKRMAKMRLYISKLSIVAVYNGRKHQISNGGRYDTITNL